MSTVTQVLSRRDVTSYAPAAGTRHPAPTLSERYVFMDTMAVIDALTSIGYMPVQATQDRVRTRNPAYARHLVVFRHKGFLKPGKIEAVPQLLWSNDHRGGYCSELRVGLYRFVCTNGMVVGKDLLSERIRHAGELAQNVIEVARTAAKQSGQLIERIEDWQAITLSDKLRNGFAREALLLRAGGDERRAKAYDPITVLEARREEDAGDSMWRVFNRVQENLTRGGIEGASATGRRLRMRPLNSITNDLTFNEGLWTLAEQYAAKARK